MRLKQIKLAGFKSFVDATKIPFEHALSAVVGPNGCGKSNVIDAVRWVLGESSAKHLRGDAMTDVIFNGSASRRPISVASVELTFDNSEGRLAGQYANFQDVSVKRQVNRDSESTYFLNGQKCRRKDITDLFMGTGLGPRSYAIIEQGTISRLIESKPQELRVFIEEAAGISRYKERRRETENRIRHTRENLERLNDIRLELGEQLEKLAAQAEDAKTYRELKANERSYHSQLLVLKWQDLQQQFDKLTKQIDKLTLEQASVDDELRQFDTSQSLVTQQLAELTATEQAKVELYYQAGNQVSRIEQQIAHQTQLDDSQRKQLADLREQLQSQKQLAEQLKQSHLTLEQSHQQLQPDIESLQQEHEIADEQAHLLEDEYEQIQTDTQQSQQKLASAQTQLAVVKAQMNHELTQLEQVKRDVSQYQAQIDEMAGLCLDDQLAELTEQQQQTIEQIDELAIALNDSEIHTSQLQQRLSEAQASLSQGKQQQASVNARLELIDELLQNQSEQATLPLWQVLQVKPGWQAAAESILQHLLQLDVLDADDFNQNTQANLGFARTSTAQQYPQKDAIVSAEVNLSPWLNHVRWVEDANEAHHALAARNNHDTHDAPNTRETICVTKAGELIGSGFQFSAAAATPVIQLSHEKQQLSDKLDELDAELEVMQQGVSGLALSQSESMLHTQDLKQSAKQKQALLTDCEQQLRALQLQQSQYQAKLDNAKNQLFKAEQAAAQYQEKIAHSESELDSHEQQQKLASASHEQVLASQTQASAQLKQLKQLKVQQSQRLQALNTQRQQLATELALSEQKQLQVDNKTSEIAQAIASINSQLAQNQQQQTQGQQQQLQQELQQYLQKQQDLDKSLQQIRTQQAELQQTLDSSLLKQKQQLEQQQGLTQRLSGLKLRREGVKGQIDAQMQLLSEHQVELESVAAQLPADAKIAKWQKLLDQTRQDISELGAINLAAIEEFDSQSERKAYLDEQDNDLNQALASLEGAIKKIDRETRARFKTTYDAVNADLQSLFPKVFGGGKAYLALTDDDLLETGVTIMAQPPGKKNSTIHLLSGGEKALTALSLVFAIFRLNPAPFCMLDEVDAPLDDANVGRFCRLLEEMSQSVQFIYISHNKITMEMAEQLIGVTMHEPGVSRIVAVDIDTAVAMADAV
ncbi:chromosome segregation protein SMC [Shewanella maritima]|uniref:Chromosome partition protein Smc n=1 Tax=Shewanella maritima TaxID=2520507 RepID=A0A411PDM9_9GAMM|nr:chromosome segregation protein SMC [Shewanella maritima]QBF81614.1 chromosome segregation protein SMC [Shewanella maritima]